MTSPATSRRRLDFNHIKVNFKKCKVVQPLHQGLCSASKLSYSFIIDWYIHKIDFADFHFRSLVYTHLISVLVILSV